MKIKSFGCSFIFGSDLADNGSNWPMVTPSKNTWPALLAQHLDYNYKCYARPGAGNLQILEQILNQVDVSTSDDLFVIGWTWIDRFDYYEANYDPQKKQSPWVTIMPIDEDPLAVVYYKQLHSEYRDKLVTLANIKLAIDTLNQKSIPFVMTYMDQLMYNQQWHTTPAVKTLQEHTQPHMTQFNGLNFLEWSRQHKFAISDAWHPLEQAHRAAADYMITVFDKQKQSTQLGRHTTIRWTS
jgi:hypothetical protein